MSYHSRSSSEVEVTPFSELLQVHLKDFRDLDFNDVKDIIRHLFTDSEFDYIDKAVSFGCVVFFFLLNK